MYRLQESFTLLAHDDTRSEIHKGLGDDRKALIVVSKSVSPRTPLRYTRCSFHQPVFPFPISTFNTIYYVVQIQLLRSPR